MALSASVSGGVAVVVVDTWPWFEPDVEGDCVTGGVFGATTVSFLHAAKRNIVANNSIDAFINRELY